MKRFLLGLFVCILFASCTKEAVLPEPAIKEFTSFKTAHISITNVHAVQAGTRNVTFYFTTEYEKNLKSIEVLSGTSESLFCQIFKEEKLEASGVSKTYTVNDKDVKASTMYYMIKYTTNAGDISFSPVFQVKLK